MAIPPAEAPKTPPRLETRYRDKRLDRGFDALRSLSLLTNVEQQVGSTPADLLGSDARLNCLFEKLPDQKLFLHVSAPIAMDFLSETACEFGP
jgi:hypothetical protein